MSRPLTTHSKSRLTHIYRNLITLFKRECEELVQAFKDKRSENFIDFIPVWKSRKFHLIYEKYCKDGVIHLLKEDSLLIAKNIMLKDHFLGGLFLLYGLYFIQEDPRSYIRIEHEEFLKLLERIKDERNNTIETCQPGYMIAKLLKNHAFAFVRFGQEYSMDGQYRSRIVHGIKSDADPTLEQSLNPRDWLNGFLKKVDFLDELKEVDEEYFRKKQELKNNHPELNLALDLVPDDLVGGLREAMYAVEDDQASTQDIGTTRRRLKERQSRKRTRYWNKKAKVKKDTSESAGNRNKKKGCPRGLRKFYFKSVVNDPESEGKEDLPSCGEEVLAMPDI